ncbi:MAG: nicotinate-nucleotide adenylyltransferase [Methylovirgula sp.]
MPARFALPPHAPGLKIGLFGGSFNPPHEGHRTASLVALHRLGLDSVWWLVSPANPLKDTRDLASFPMRIAAARAVAHHPRIEVTGLEAEIGARYTYQTIRYLKRHCPGVHFVWIMGADNLSTLHRWRRWREIAGNVAIAVVDRPGSTLAAAHAPAAAALAPYRRNANQARVFAMQRPPAIIFLYGPRSTLSSTALRAPKAA